MLLHLKMNITFQFCFNLPEKNSKIGASSDCIKFTVITVQVVNSTVFFGGKMQTPWCVISAILTLWGESVENFHTFYFFEGSPNQYLNMSLNYFGQSTMIFLENFLFFYMKKLINLNWNRIISTGINRFL